MWLLSLALILLLYTFGPGMILVRPLRLAPAERFVVAIGLGLFVTFLLSFAIFALGLSQNAHLATSIVALVLGLAAFQDWRRLLRSRQVRRLLICWACILAWGLVLLSMIRHFGGGTWSGDWTEHLERTSFFLSSSLPGFTLQQTFLQGLKYPVPMRPPMMNAVTAGVLAQAVGTEQAGDLPPLLFPSYQLTFLFLNSLVFLPCALLVPRLVKLSPRLVAKATWTLTAVFAASPMFCQNLTYAWTKLFAAFYAVLAICVYLRAWRRASKDEGGKRADTATARERMKDEKAAPRRSFSSSFILHPSSLRFPLSFGLLCIGFLVHYSVGPYALFVGLHYLIAVWWRRPSKWREAGIIGGISLAILAVWFGWSISVYGRQTTFASPSTVSDAVKMTPAENVASIGRNFRNTLIPRIVQRPDLIRDYPIDAPPATIDPAETNEDVLSIHDLEQPSAAGRVRDFFFLIYQVSLPGGLGLIGWLIACWLLWRAWRPGAATDRRLRVFWMAFISAIVVVAVATYGGRDRFGVAHVSLQPLILIGLTLLAGGFWTLSVPMRALFAAGLIVDFALGVFLHATLQHYVFQLVPVFDAAGRQVSNASGQPEIMLVPSPDILSHASQYNFGQKEQAKLPFWGDYFPGALPFQVLLGLGLTALMVKGLLPPWPRREPEIPIAARAPKKSPKKRR
jgi:hypothetical protein